jgi:beta-lactam-binding protein with PASTA domain
VSLLWDGVDHLVTVESVGTFSATFVVPESASLESHSVVAQCRQESAAFADFIVTVEEARTALEEAQLVLGQVSGTGDEVRDQNPTAGTEVRPGTAVDVVVGTVIPALVVVPNLVDSSVADAENALQAEGLVLGSVSGDGNVIVSQSPVGGAEVPPRTAVNVVVAPPVPELVTVPNLVGSDVDDVPGVLVSSGLVLGQTSGSGDIVRSQTPAAGVQVPRGSAVNVSVALNTPPEQLVEVPDLADLTVDEVREALTAEGLVLGNEPDGAGVVESQTPAAGTLVPLESAVTVTLAEISPWPSAATLTVLAVALIVLAAALVLRAIRPRRGPRWVRAHVRAAAATAVPSDQVEVADSRRDGSPPTCRVRLVPHADRGTQVLEEVDR